MPGHFFLPRSHFDAKKANEAQVTHNTTVKTSADENGTITPSQPDEATPDNTKKMSEEDYDAQIASLNERITQLKKELESPTYGSNKQNTTTPTNQVSTAQAATKETHTVSSSKPTTDCTDWLTDDEIKAKDEEVKKFKAELREREKLESHRYSSVGLQLQLFAEWALTREQRQRYREKLARVNEKRKAEGKSLK